MNQLFVCGLVATITALALMPRDARALPIAVKGAP